jgi:hypothetical protein
MRKMISIAAIRVTCMCRLRHINDLVLSSLKMEGIRLLFHAFCSLCVCDSPYPLSVKSLKNFKLFHTFLSDKFNNDALFC